MRGKGGGGEQTARDAGGRDHRWQHMDFRSFAHQLAKVRVKLEGEKADEVENVYVRSYLTKTMVYDASGNATLQ